MSVTESYSTGHIVLYLRLFRIPSKAVSDILT